MPARYNIVQTPVYPEEARPIVSIGAGGIVHDAHYPAYRKAGFQVAGLFDLDAQRARAMAAAFEVPRIFASLEEAVAEAPAGTVFDVAVPAAVIQDILPFLPDGSGVLIQKPMGESLAEARQIRALCRRKQLTAAINFQMRYAPFVLAARSLIDQGAIGELHDLEVRVTVYTPWHLWTFLHGMEFPEFLYHSIHYMDLIRSFLGDPRRVYAKVVSHPHSPLKATRTSTSLDYGDSIRATITTNHHHNYGLRHQESYVKWEGTRGAIIARMGLLMNYPAGEPDWFEYCVLEGNREGNAEPTWRSVELAGSWFPDAFIGTMSSVMRAVEGSTEDLPTSVDDAYRTMAVVEAACTSSRSGGTPIPMQET